MNGTGANSISSNLTIFIESGNTFNDRKNADIPKALNSYLSKFFFPPKSIFKEGDSSLYHYTLLSTEK
jgi:hypothetical protein